MSQLPDTQPEDALARLHAQNAALSARLEDMEHYTARALMRATRLSQVIAVLGSHDDLDRTIDRAAIEVAELFSADLALLVVDTGAGPRVEGQWGIESGEIPEDPAEIVALDELAPADPVTVAAASSVPLPAWLAAYDPRHVAFARLTVGDKAVGLMLLLRRAEDPFVSEEATELRAIAHRIALAIENGLLQRNMRSQLAQLHRLQRLTAELAGTIQLDAIGAMLADTLVSEAEVSRCVVYVERDGSVAAIASAGTDGGEEPELMSSGTRWERFQLIVAEKSVGYVAVAEPPAERSEAHEMLLHLTGLGALAIDKALAYDRSVEQARHDSLTGLLGHRVFYETLDALVSASPQFSIILLDIDDFKEINDLQGHQRGDEVLCLVADAMRGAVRTGDTIFRIGGEEFCSILPGAHPDEAELIADRLRTAVSDVSAELPHPITISAGVAGFREHARARDKLIAAADAALYQSKRSGKNRTTIAGGRTSVGVPVERTQALELLVSLDPEMVAHGVHTAILAVRIARALDLDDERIADLHTAAKLHDIGKIGIPPAILRRPGPLDDDEFRIVKTHPVVGAQLLRAWGYERPAEFVLAHHERIDGGGYPSQLAGDQIALESRIIHAAEAYFAMTVDRPHQRALSQEAALAELGRCRGTQFDERVVDALVVIAHDGLVGERRAA